MANVIQGSGTYVVHDLVGENSRFRYYRASSDARKDQELMLKIGATQEQNGVLDREAFLLALLAEEADRLEAEYTRGRTDDATLNYRVGFPSLVETFIAQAQGARRVLVLAYDAADSLAELAPLSLIRQRDQVRVDPKTSAWIMGKMLKILAFAHGLGIAVRDLSGSNVLIVREHHLVVVHDWSSAVVHKDSLAPNDIRDDIRKAAREVLLLLGFDAETGRLPESEQLPDDQYEQFLTGLARGASCDAFQAHSAFYEVVEAHWGRTFHPYTTFPL